MALLGQQLGRLPQTRVADEVARRLVGQLLELAVQMHAADADLLRYEGDVQILVGQVRIDDVHDALHQPVVRRLDAELGHLVVLRLAAAEVVAQRLAVAYQVRDRGAQHLDAERLLDVGVGADAQAADVVGLRRFGRQQHHRHVVDVDVVLYLPAQFEAVHLGHHYVADYQVRSLLQHRSVGVLAVLEVAHGELAAQLGADVVANLLVIFGKHNRETLPGLGLRHRSGVVISLGHRRLRRHLGCLHVLGFGLLVGQFRRLQVRVAQRNPDHKEAAAAVVVGGADAAVMLLHKLARQVQADARTHYAGVVLVELVEPLENQFGLVGRNAHAVVADADDGMAGFGAQPQADASSARREFERVRQQVEDNLVEIGRVNPHNRLVLSVFVAQLNLFGLGLIFEIGTYFGQQRNQVGGTEAEFHLTFVNLSYIHQLVDELQKPVGVVIDGAVVFAPLGVGVGGKQPLQRAYYQRHRRANLVRYVDKELQFGLVDFLGVTVLNHQLPHLIALPDERHHNRAYQDDYQEIDYLRRHRSVPGRVHHDHKRLGRRKGVAHAGAHAEVVAAGLQVAVRGPEHAVAERHFGIAID